ncbi:MAG: cephalosporin hydroxylase [Microgenomates group bacterium Gr01-1014_93]|nr:MAG: cephalosporin hydroxylase [Microgenomates group bacterium Gr01-1014_93]
MDPIEKFESEKREIIAKLSENEKLKNLATEFLKESSKCKYIYNFSWLGRPIIQYPQDIIAVQELIWSVKPDLIIETGIAHGGSLILSASILELIGGDGLVVGVDIDIRQHNRILLEKHHLFKRIKLIEGSSTDGEVIKELKEISAKRGKVMIFLDSSHTHDHVLSELQLYSPMVSVGSYLVVFDTVLEILPEISYLDRPWSRGNNPQTAVNEFLKSNESFIIDKSIEDKLLITANRSGYLKKISQ